MTLDSIRNSCDVLKKNCEFFYDTTFGSRDRGGYPERDGGEGEEGEGEEGLVLEYSSSWMVKCLSVCPTQKSLFLYSRDLVVSHVSRHFPYSVTLPQSYSKAFVVLL